MTAGPCFSRLASGCPGTKLAMSWLQAGPALVVRRLGTAPQKSCDLHGLYPCCKSAQSAAAALDACHLSGRPRQWTHGNIWNRMTEE